MVLWSDGCQRGMVLQVLVQALQVCLGSQHRSDKKLFSVSAKQSYGFRVLKFIRTTFSNTVDYFSQEKKKWLLMFQGENQQAALEGYWFSG